MSISSIGQSLGAVIFQQHVNVDSYSNPKPPKTTNGTSGSTAGGEMDTVELSRAAQLKQEILNYRNETWNLYWRGIREEYYRSDKYTPEDMRDEFLRMVERDREFMETTYAEYEALVEENETSYRSFGRTMGENLTSFYSAFRIGMYSAAKGATVLDCDDLTKETGEPVGFGYDADHYWKAHDAMALIDEAMKELCAREEYAGARIKDPSEIENPTYRGYNYTFREIEGCQRQCLTDLEFVPPRDFELYFSGRLYTPQAEKESTRYSFAFSNADWNGGITCHVDLPKGRELFKRGMEIAELERYLRPTPQLGQDEKPYILYDLTSLIPPATSDTINDIAEEFMRTYFNNKHAGMLRVNWGGETYTREVPFWVWDKDTTRRYFNAAEVMDDTPVPQDILRYFDLFHPDYSESSYSTHRPNH